MAKYKHQAATKARTRKRLAAKPATGHLDRHRTALNESSISEKWDDEKHSFDNPPKTWNFKD